MEKKKPLILVTNDDGVEAEGIKKLTEALCSLGEVIVFAPDSPHSGMSSAITHVGPVKYKLVEPGESVTVYSCSGTPVDCVKLSVNEVLHRKPDLLVSGINHGGNQALSVHYSGTMGAAFEGCTFGIPSIGISMDKYVSGADFSESCRLGIALSVQVLNKGLPRGTYLNLNVPNRPVVKGIAAGRQTDGKWVREYRTEIEASGETVYWLTGDYESYGEDYPDNDITLLEKGYASLVPCKVDVTDYPFMEELKKWDF